MSPPCWLAVHARAAMHDPRSRRYLANALPPTGQTTARAPLNSRASIGTTDRGGASRDWRPGAGRYLAPLRNSLACA